ncbi:TetR/AcrR family transcriptional regulator [Paralcaligenes sp. KSB-10]|jgi:AcrR family transcriptional regulator|uniref:TetR/AcrR family transcriptional regulator n=1 Tax=Paralcaligenes sp. KSB-10 TaxID=2901142 RepID=UPI001E3A6C04|nr:TetR/AcrR family transcriptional regulator [Paralcaligenes sp. KSB-10]UHL64403.1 TetR/AcrR family transcriptional regulator [Paralcaligenes sp. KSB-10]
MISDFESFKIELSLSKDEIYRELYRKNKDRIRIKKEYVAVKNLARIIESTLRLASSKGFHAMSLRDLCADSGFSIGGLYAYIKNKDDLIHLIQSHGFILTRRTMLAYTQGIDAARDKLFAAIKTHLYLSELMLAWFSFSFMEAKSLPAKEKKEAIAIELEIENIIFDIIEQGVAAQAFKPIDARLLSSVIKAMMQDWYLKRRKYRNQAVNVTQYAEFVMGILESYLLR